MNDSIVIDPDIQHGKPIIKGTRVPIARVLGGLAGGMTRQEVIDEYGIKESDLVAVLRYAVQLIETERFYPLADKAA